MIQRKGVIMKKVLYSLLASAIVAAFAFIPITNNVLPPEKAQATTSPEVTTSTKAVLEEITIGYRHGRKGIYLHSKLRNDTGQPVWYWVVYNLEEPVNASNASLSDLTDAAFMYIKLHNHSTSFHDIREDVSNFARDFSTIVKSAEFQSYLSSVRCSELELENTLKASEFHIVTPTVLCQDASSLFAELDSNLN